MKEFEDTETYYDGELVVGNNSSEEFEEIETPSINEYYNLEGGLSWVSYWMDDSDVEDSENGCDVETDQEEVV